MAHARHIPRRALLTHAVAVLAAAAVGACDRRSRPPTPPPVPAGPRIVALAPAVAITLRDLGLEHQIVGRHSADLILPESVPVCGDQLQIDIEAVIAANPTHVLTQWGRRDLPARLLEVAARRGWVLHDSSPLTLDAIHGDVRELGDLLGCPGEAALVNARLDKAWSPRGPDGGRFTLAGRVLLLASVSPPRALGPGGWHHEILTRIGAEPALTTGGAWIEMDREDLIAARADAIVLVDPRARHAPRADAEGVRARFAPLRGLNVPAVANGRTALIDDPLAQTPSTAAGAFADQLAEILAGWSVTGPG